MEKIRLDPNQLPPMPVALAGTMVEGRVNFMAAGWITRLGFKPPLIGVSINHRQWTGSGSRRPARSPCASRGRRWSEKTDYCGLVSGRNADKSALFDVFYGETPGAPMIRECPLCLECGSIRPWNSRSTGFLSARSKRPGPTGTSWPTARWTWKNSNRCS